MGYKIDSWTKALMGQVRTTQPLQGSRALNLQAPIPEYDTFAIKTKLLTEAAAVKLERYSAEYFEQKYRSNAERAARLERRIAKKTEAGKLRAEAERLRAEEELCQD